ncbi:MAG: hypothetical protein NC092_08510 [Butyrivibrio sp.]|nr:hypothetical protein [Muribaculum sp.]MCM1552718.1 hypothetical protein [Butyrivibrio sp.]
MDLKMTISDPTAIQVLAEEDVTRLKNELNYRLLMAGDWSKEVLWVEELTVTKVEPPVRGRAMRRLRMRLRRLQNRLFILLRASAKRLTCFKNKTF